MNGDTNALLITKLHTPRWRKQAIPRPDLLRKLDRGLEQGWILIAAVAGAGKTSLVVEWIEQVGHPACWLSLDEGDSDPTRFFTYLIAAIQTKEPSFGQDLLPLLQSPHSPPTGEFLTRLINALATLPNDLIIVLDDYHLIADEQVHHAIARLLSQVPDSITFVLATRADPPLPLARMRTNGELVEVRVDALSFSQVESTRLFNESFDLGLTSKQVTTLNRRTEGWIAGLQLAALALQAHAQDRAAFIDSFAGSHRHVLDYLMEEVLLGQPEEIRDFLMATSAVYRFNAELCNTLLQRVDSARILDYLERNNLFLIPLDDSRQWYRYHHLFADLLRAQLALQRPDAVQQIRTQAAEWHAAQGDNEQAIDYAFTAGAFDYAADLMQAHMMTSYWQTALQTWRRWYDLWPSSFAESHPLLTYLCGYTLIVHGFLEEATPLLQQVDSERLDLANQLMFAFLNVHQQKRFGKLCHPCERVRASADGPLGKHHAVSHCRIRRRL